MSSSKTPCAACKLQRRKCTQECVFAPYFPPDNPRKFSNVQQVFGASNVSKLLTELNVAHREEAVRSLAYEAEARLRDPVYGCVGLISVLQQRLRHVQNEVDKAKKELATYIGPQALQPMVPVLDPHHGMVPLHPHHQGNVYGPSVFPYNNMPPQAMGARGGQLVIREPQQQHRDEQQMLGSQLATDMEVRQVQELFGIYDQQQQPPTTQQQQKDFMSYGGGGGAEMGSVSGSGFNQPPEMSPSLALNTYDNTYRSVQLQQSQGGDQQHHHHQAPRHHLQEQMLLPPQQPQQPQHQNQPLHHQLQEQLLLSPQQPQQQPLLSPQQLQPQPPAHQLQAQQHQHHHHQLQEQLFLRPQQPQPYQDQHQHHQPPHNQLQEQLLLQPHQHQEQSEDTDGRSVGPS
ncbi:LOB domain-containing protein 36-like [Neltuma alba]|uniref:LOB domain-containing protein 36-like n=1 Tax=Neltuma alba TaxID=207710 RepID=UPI0010A37B5F|nr:LOB domain-containing protein 36-like [Prosopis alba]